MAVLVLKLTRSSLDPCLCIHVRPGQPWDEGVLLRDPNAHRVPAMGDAGLHSGDAWLACRPARSHGDCGRPHV